MTEIDEMRRGQVALSDAGATLFRHNVALAVVGKITWIRDQVVVRLNPGDAVVRQARPLHAGLVKGGSDLLGWTSIVITPDMVGETVAVFTAVEWKTRDGRLEPEQQTFINNVKRAGGFAGVARTVAEALGIIRK